jgi:hypothetical protein
VVAEHEAVVRSLFSSLRRAERSRAAPPARGVTAHCTVPNETRGAAAPDPARYDGQVAEGMVAHLLEEIPVPGLGREPGHDRTGTVTAVPGRVRHR